MEEAPNALIGKQVLDAKGIIIGTIQKSIKDAVTGEIVSVIIKPLKQTNLQNYAVTDFGEIIFPYTSLSSVKDVVIIEDPLQ